MATTPSLRARIAGSLLGSAVGDAVGAATEFQAVGTFDPVRPDEALRGGGAHRLRPGQWTDDTSLSLALATSLLTAQAFDPLHQLQLYWSWWDCGRFSSTGACFDIGSATSRALAEFARRRDAGTARARDDAWCSSPRAAGNGSIMRLAPLPLLLHAHPAAAVTLADLSSRTTHDSVEARDCCRYLAALVVGAVAGAPKADLLQDGGYVPHGLPPDYWASRPLCPAVADVALRRSFARRLPPTPPQRDALMALPDGATRKAALAEYICNSGFAPKSLEAALHALLVTDTFADGTALVANLGDDADSVAAVYGMVAGAVYGVHAIPDVWRAGLTFAPLFEELASALTAVSEGVRVTDAGDDFTCPPPPATTAAAVRLHGAVDAAYNTVRRGCMPGPRAFKDVKQLEAAVAAVHATIDAEADGVPPAVVTSFAEEVTARLGDLRERLAVRLRRPAPAAPADTK